MPYLDFDDPIQALAIASRLVQESRWKFWEDQPGHPHVSERESRPGKDPSLTSAEVRAVFANARECRHEKESRNFFRIQSELDVPHWRGHGRIIFHIESDPAGPDVGAVVVITAFRVHGWRPHL